LGEMGNDDQMGTRKIHDTNQGLSPNKVTLIKRKRRRIFAYSHEEHIKEGKKKTRVPKTYIGRLSTLTKKGIGKYLQKGGGGKRKRGRKRISSPRLKENGKGIWK